MNQSVDQFFSSYLGKYLEGNLPARLLAESLAECGVGLMPLVDHCTLRTLDVETRAGEVIELGFRWDEGIGILEFDTWWAKVYRKPGFPALFIDQAYAGERGKGSLIPQWVETHGDRCFHHVAVRVDNIESAIAVWRGRGIEFAGSVVGAPGTDLRQIFTKPEMRKGKVYTVLELIERHNGYSGFLPPQADGLMESTRQ
ncbi:MAG: hypothetical protein ACE5E9_04780 [Nitrospinaceae bacterium]